MAEPATTGVLVELDDRRRASFDRVGRHERYLVREERDGTLVLTPAVVMKVSDLEALVGRKGACEVTREQPPKKTEVAANPAYQAPAPPSRIATAVLDVVRAAGAQGISARDIVRSVDGSRSRIYNELAVLRNTGKVSNLTGKYVFTG